MTSTAMSGDEFSALKSTFWPAIEAELEAVVPRRPEGPSLEAMTWYHFSTGGKRLRALIPLAVAEALGCAAADAIPLGAAIEMLHNATLVHDDLQDGDTHRRGLETVWRRFGAAQAINCGDAMFYYTLLLAARTPRPPEVILRLSDRILKHTLDVIAGQAAEFALKDKPTPHMADYFDVVRGKTSGLFTLPLVAGAIVAQAPEPTIHQLERIGDPLGVLFQVQDDLLDLVGDKGRDSKATDIAEGKISLPAAHLMETAPVPVREEFGAILRKPREETTSKDIEQALALLDAHGSLAYTAQLLVSTEAQVGTLCAELDSIALRRVIIGLADLFMAPVRHALPATPR